VDTDRIERTHKPQWSERLVEPASMAAIVFLSLLAAGAVLLLAAKLQFPSLGSGAGPYEVLKAIGLIALASLGVTIDLDGLELSVIPLGVLVAVGLLANALSRQFVRDDARSRLDALLVGIVTGVLAFVAALVFRFDGDASVTASAVGALFYGTLWGTVIAAVGIWWGRGGPGDRALKLPGVLDESFRLALPTGAAAAFGTVVMLLCLVIARLIADPLPRSFGLGDAIAAILYLLAFLPNVMVAIFSLAVGATLEIGAQFDVGGELVGPLKSISLWDWGSGGSPARWLLLLLPLGVGLRAGSLAYERTTSPSGALRSLAGCAVLLAVVVGTLAAIGDARLGAGLVKQNGVGLVAVDALQAATLTFLWVAGGGGLTSLVMSKLQERKEGRGR
jgi:hypothetical protein